MRLKNISILIMLLLIFGTMSSCDNQGNIDISSSLSATSTSETKPQQITTSTNKTTVNTTKVLTTKSNITNEITRIENYSWGIEHVLNAKNEKDFIKLVKKIKNLDSLATLIGCEKEEISKKYRFNKENFDMILKDKCFYVLKDQNIRYYDLSDSKISFIWKEGKLIDIFTKKMKPNFDKLAFVSTQYGEVYYDSKAYFFEYEGYLVKLSGYEKLKEAKRIINNIEFEKHYIK